MTPHPSGAGLRDRRAGQRLLAVLAALAALTSAAVVAAAPPAAATHRVAPSVFQCEQFRPTLYQGVAGQAGCVAAVQNFLKFSNSAGNFEVDGIFGPRTKDQVVWFQARMSIGTDGIVGPQTWSRIYNLCLVDPKHNRVCQQHPAY